MTLIDEIYIDFYFKKNNLITNKGILFLILIKNKNKLSILLLKLGFYKNNLFDN